MIKHSAVETETPRAPVSTAPLITLPSLTNNNMQCVQKNTL